MRAWTVVALCCAAMLNIAASAAQTTSGATTVSGPFDKRIAGIWELQSQTVQGAEFLVLTIAPGNYVLDVSLDGNSVLHDKGGFNASGGNYRWTPPKGSPFNGTYSFITPNALQLTRPNGTDTWNRKRGTSAPAM